MLNLISRLLMAVLLALPLLAGLAHADNLMAGPGDPLWMHIGAYALLYAHIGGGAVGLVSGVVAIAAPKGRRVHRTAGAVFLVSMFVTYLIGAGVAPFLQTGQRPNFVAGVMALYLLLSGWFAANQRVEIRAGLAQYAGLAFALGLVAMGAAFAWMGSQSETGTVDGSPPQAFILFMVAGSFAAAGELHVILRKAIRGAARTARHLWRMCFSMFIASGSLFFGQPQVFPQWFHDTTLPIWLGFAPLLAMVVWLVIVRIPRKRRVPVAVTT
ncbi:hypothetical protein [Hyphomonas sp.]|uniref:hypothetical protein n=1 Tax=Hyphomonas sp. TaxID=87 RepID=UPI00391A6237